MSTSQRLLGVAALVATTLLAAGCAADAGTPTPTSTAGSDDTIEAPIPTEQVDAVWLDGGKMIGLVSWQSSNCPMVLDSSETTDAQTIGVELLASETDASACSDILSQRAYLIGTPQDVDPTQDVSIVISIDGIQTSVELAGEADLATGDGPTISNDPSAAWTEDDSVVLLTWGSSSCVPLIDSVEGEGATGTVTFRDRGDEICTMDFAPRATVIPFNAGSVDHDGFVLTMVGADLDGTVEVR